jgi:hypothetical protein
MGHTYGIPADLYAFHPRNKFRGYNIDHAKGIDKQYWPGTRYSKSEFLYKRRMPQAWSIPRARGTVHFVASEFIPWEKSRKSSKMQ